MTNSSPIGIFDSGLGGLTVTKKIIKKLPSENIIYIGDEAHVPYGEKSPGEIRDYALGITDYFLRQNAKIVVMACNMSSANALQTVRNLHPAINVIGTIEAGSRRAIEIVRNKIGILATKGTVATKAYTKTINKMRKDIEVVEQGCPLFVPIVENDMCDSDEAYRAAEEYISPLIDAGCDTIVLGCTHYPFLLDAITAASGPDVNIVDPAEYTADEIYAILKETGILNSPEYKPAHVYNTTAYPERFKELGSKFLGENVSVNQIQWGIDLREKLWSEKMEGQIISSAP